MKFDTDKTMMLYFDWQDLLNEFSDFYSQFKYWI